MRYLFWVLLLSLGWGMITCAPKQDDRLATLEIEVRDSLGRIVPGVRVQLFTNLNDYQRTLQLYRGNHLASDTRFAAQVDSTNGSGIVRFEGLLGAAYWYLATQRYRDNSVDAYYTPQFLRVGQVNSFGTIVRDNRAECIRFELATLTLRNPNPERIRIGGLGISPDSIDFLPNQERTFTVSRNLGEVTARQVDNLVGPGNWVRQVAVEFGSNVCPVLTVEIPLICQSSNFAALVISNTNPDDFRVGFAGRSDSVNVPAGSTQTVYLPVSSNRLGARKLTSVVGPAGRILTASYSLGASCAQVSLSMARVCQEDRYARLTVANPNNKKFELQVDGSPIGELDTVGTAGATQAFWIPVTGSVQVVQTTGIVGSPATFPYTQGLGVCGDSRFDIPAVP